jgi:hypothetical protein
VYINIDIGMSFGVQFLYHNNIFNNAFLSNVLKPTGAL